jgi:hypothetical protein
LVKITDKEFWTYENIGESSFDIFFWFDVLLTLSKNVTEQTFIVTSSSSCAILPEEEIVNSE